MRYSRMKEQSTHIKDNTPNRSGRFIFILILAAAVIYIVAATKAGDIFSEKVIIPAVEFFAGKNADTPPSEVASAVFSDQDDLITDELTLPQIAQYLLQYGVFSSEENAENAAKELFSIGGAGYIREEDGQFRVIISGYSSREDAINVKDRLETDRGMQTKLIELTAPELNCTITSNPDHLESVRNIIAEIQKTHDELLNSALELDKGILSAEDASAHLDQFKSAIKTHHSTVNTLSEKTDDPLITALDNYFIKVNNSAETIDDDLSGALLSSALKRAYIGSAYAYYDLLRYDTSD